MRSTEERLMRLAVQADEGHTRLKLNDQNMEDDVTITQEDLNTWKKKPYMENYQTLYRKIRWTENAPYSGFPHAISILKRKGIAVNC